jgi:hypothetical protein
VPECDAKKVLAELDFREKGGYTRRVVDVEKLDGSGTVKVSGEREKDLESSCDENPSEKKSEKQKIMILILTPPPLLE